MKKFYPLSNYFSFNKGFLFIKRAIAIFILFSFSIPLSAQVTFSYSYLNVTRSNGGGTLEKGDIIEVRALAKIDSKISNFYYIDTIRPGTQYINNSLKIVTNEGLLFRGPYTNTSGDDLGVYDISGSTPRIRINVGTGAANPVSGTGAAQFGSTSGGGTVSPGDKPKFYGTTLIIVAYQLLVTANFDDQIYLTGNYFYDSTTSKGITVPGKKYRFDYAPIKIVHNQALCNNFSSATFTAESDFGSGKTQNRPLAANVPGYIKTNMGANAPNDNYYAIANNTSSNGTTGQVFGAWDIIGDHTGAVNAAIGNAPAKVGVEGGYMLVVNAAYATGEAYRDVIKNVCPNTYYEFSAWIRNICGKCSADSNGTSKNLPGALPNLAFTINDIDYYTTGNIDYTQTWVKRGFIYKTGPAETQFTITIKNNAAGGGGNDWVLDDIKLATCYPNLIMNPNDTARACTGGDYMLLSDTVKSYFNNYGNYCWEKSMDGINWTSTGVCGKKDPVLIDGLYVYYVDTAFVPTKADSGTFYRLKVGTTEPNLGNPNCAVNGSQRVFLKVNGVGCKPVEAKILAFSAIIENSGSKLKWVTENEINLKEYIIERSFDGIHFSKVGTVAALSNAKGGTYVFEDPQNISNIVYYRLQLMNADRDSYKSSKTIVLYNRSAPFKISTVNPFRNNLKIDVFVPENGLAEVALYDIYGNAVIKRTYQMNKGNSTKEITNARALPSGIYILRALYNGISIQQKLIKTN